MENRTIPHNRLVDRQPTGNGFTATGKVKLRKITRRVKISVDGKAALLTRKQALALAVGPGRMPAAAAAAARVAWIDEGNIHSDKFSLVLQESAQARKAPGVDAPALSFTRTDPITDIGKVLKHQDVA